MTEEDWRSREKRRAQGCSNWTLGAIAVGLIFAYFGSTLDWGLDQEPKHRFAQNLLTNQIKLCMVIDARLGLAQPSNGPTHADISTADMELSDWIITHSIYARKLEPRSSCYSVAAISRDNSMASYQITYNKSTGKLLKNCLPAIKGDNSGCKDGTW